MGARRHLPRELRAVAHHRDGRNAVPHRPSPPSRSVMPVPAVLLPERPYPCRVHSLGAGGRHAARQERGLDAEALSLG